MHTSSITTHKGLVEQKSATQSPAFSSSDVCLVPGADQARVTQGKAAMLDSATYSDLAAIFHALADASRVKVVYSLLWQELCTCDLAAITGLSESGVSQHLRVLRELRLVKSRREGKMVFYTLDDNHIVVLLSVCLEHLHDAGQQSDEISRVLELIGQRS